MSEILEIYKQDSGQVEQEEAKFCGHSNSQSNATAVVNLRDFINYVDNSTLNIESHLLECTLNLFKENFAESTLSIENHVNKRRLEVFNEKYTQKLIRTIREQEFEYGYNSAADSLVSDLMKQNETITKEWINSIFLYYYHDTVILLGILQVISRIDYFKIYPQGQSMALSALAHSNLEVQECAIRAFENWSTLESLNILKNVKCGEKWLQDYVNQVIMDLEEDFEQSVATR